MTLVGWLQIALTLALVVVCAIPLSRIIAGAYAGERNFLTPVLGPVERAFYRLAGVDPAREQDWFALHDRDGRLFRRRIPVALRLAAAAELSAAEPARLRRRRARSRLQHLFQLHHQHELAELQRRDHDESSHPDARPHRAQLRLGGDGPRHGVRARTRICALVGGDGRQLLGRPDPGHALHPPADLGRRRARVRRSRHAADAGRRGRRDDPRGREADHFDRAGREPGDHQGARHQRRRILQRQRRSSVREPERLDQFPRDLGPAADPDGLGARLWPLRGRPAAGLGHSGGDGGLPHCRHRGRLLVGDRRQSDPDGARRGPVRGQSGRQRGPQRSGDVGPVSPPRPPAPARARSTPCTIR